MEFLSDDILLTSQLAKDLYRSYARDLPIIDYHCHIDPKDILQDRKFENITQLWLYGDHYKWRLMRNCGADERFITGGADDFQKFEAFARCLPRCIGNPIYVWCHMELKGYFGYEGEINGSTARRIFDFTKEKLASSEFSVRNIIRRSNVEIICTTDDPADDLSAHIQLKREENLGFKVLPSFRPDRAIHVEKKDFPRYVEKLQAASGVKIDGIESLKEALLKRLDFFHRQGCKVSDHALDSYIYRECGDAEAERIFQKATARQPLDELEVEKFQTYMLLFLAKKYAGYGMAMQLHYNCLRNNNSVMSRKLGSDTGFDSINSSRSPVKLARLLDALYEEGCLPKTIVYSLDPNDDKLINTIINCFQSEAVGKLQHGSAWWFNDTKCGIASHLATLAEYSVLGNFIGMLTDSRSFTSYIRHDYFRRLLCDFVANQVNNGEYPNNKENLKTLIDNICYYNVKNYLF